MKFKFIIIMAFVSLTCCVSSNEYPDELKVLIQNGLYENCQKQSFIEERNFFCDERIISEYANILLEKIIGKEKSQEYSHPYIIDKEENWFVIFIRSNEERDLYEKNGMVNILNIDKNSYAMIIKKENGHLISMMIF